MDLDTYIMLIHVSLLLDLNFKSHNQQKTEQKKVFFFKTKLTEVF